ncbi:hypothetical protein [Ectothiorhodospira lacustris]|uniref:hypothetical protein n=1 Tax=Ectothiorhodospira lacustris TaxID=2899127 RepID=UPI001EE8E228|nr:hypothetical protein [Ectothiorhodospira lacustris]MCG5501159.1 hypothetical protein [Ectothiorhodospira lacustris]MCG5509537.1 hypothetical protein [Ectothiorhodospira lacustris]MCG5521668.1 hypothetical protein [Ectothiorhodospira lacustris]
MMTYLLAVGLIFLMFAGWVLVQAAARRLARRHPELGPFREGGGCGTGQCGCGSPCSKRRQAVRDAH